MERFLRFLIWLDYKATLNRDYHPGDGAPLSYYTTDKGD